MWNGTLVPCLVPSRSMHVYVKREMKSLKSFSIPICLSTMVSDKAGGLRVLHYVEWDYGTMSCAILIYACLC